MQKIFFIRHGQTPNNLAGNMNSGDDDDILTQFGVDQAKQAGIEFKKTGIKLDVMISSSLIRAYTTGKLIANELGFTKEIIVDNRLREQDGGVFKGRNRDELKKEFNTNDNIPLRKIFKNKKYNKIEDVTEFDERVTDVLKEITEKYPDQNILIVGHSGTSRPLMRNIKGLGFEQAHYEMKGLNNAEIIQLK